MNIIDDSQIPATNRRLGGGDIGVCLTRLHHDRYTPYRAVPDEVRARDAALGFEHEANVLSLLRTLHEDVVDVGNGPQVVGRTLEAMSSGAAFITSGRLESTDGISVGAPDLLVRVTDGYAAVEIKNHKVIGASGVPAHLTPLDDITSMSGEDTKLRSYRRRDLLQVAHYDRLLHEAGYGSDAAMGGVIGSEEPYGCLWVSFTSGEPSIADDYVTILERSKDAIAEGALHPDTPAYGPWWRTECKGCDWRDLCKAELESVSDVTLLSRVGEDDREELALAGITRIEHVADLDPNDNRLPDTSVVLQARARTTGGLLRRDASDGPLDVPTAHREVDFDIETYNGEIYLAGFLVTVDDVSVFEPVYDWADPAVGEERVVAAMFDKLATFADDDTIVLHWTDYERRTLRQAAERHDLSIPGFASVDDWFDRHAVDLCAWARTTLISPNGYGLKVIAPLCGFEWRDDDPGGRQSEVWFEHALDGDNDMRERLLAYNEDDVIAQLAIREWIRAQDSGAGPGSAILPADAWPPS